MGRMLGVVLCALAACADVAPVADFDLAKMAGKWYIVGFATNSQWFVNHKDSMKMGTSIMTPTELGDIDLSSARDGTTTTTCAWSMLFMITTLWSTPSRPRTASRRSSTNFTAAHR